MKHLFASIFLLATIYLLACATEANSQRPLNPNGDSELSLLMRAMYEDGLKMKSQVENGKHPKPSVDVEQILTAEATDPERQKTPHFDAFAQSYLQAVKALQNARPEEAEQHYNGMVNACMSCHKAICPGPTVRIKKLYL
jgi:cytochrome c556